MIDNLITAINGLASSLNGTLDIGIVNNDGSKSSKLSDKKGIKSVVEQVKKIVDIAKGSGVAIKVEDAGSSVTGEAAAVLNAGAKGGGTYDL